jgi:2-dehydropantoate 2-reductase
MAGLEQCNWSLKELRRSKLLTVVAKAAKEAARGCAKQLEVKPGLYTMLPLKTLFRGAGFLAPKLSPFPLETYLQYHFTKVGDQTRNILDNWIAECEANNVPCPNLIELMRGLELNN